MTKVIYDNMLVDRHREVLTITWYNNVLCCYDV